jgi:hypothetical protein
VDLRIQKDGPLVPVLIRITRTRSNSLTLISLSFSASDERARTVRLSQVRFCNLFCFPQKSGSPFQILSMIIAIPFFSHFVQKNQNSLSFLNFQSPPFV